MKTPRVNKSKEQIEADLKQIEKVKHIKHIVRETFPLLKVDTIYDAQTVLNALQGFIKVELEKRVDDIKIRDLNLSFKEEKDSNIKETMVNIIRFMAEESADDFSQIAERLARAFSDFGAQKFLKNPMDSLKIEEILAE